MAQDQVLRAITDDGVMLFTRVDAAEPADVRFGDVRCGSVLRWIRNEVVTVAARSRRDRTAHAENRAETKIQTAHVAPASEIIAYFTSKVMSRRSSLASIAVRLPNVTGVCVPA